MIHSEIKGRGRHDHQYRAEDRYSRYLSCDIGAYNTCRHLCRYCYANAEPQEVLARSRRHDPLSPFLIGDSREDDVIHDVPQRSWIDGQMRLGI